MIRHIMLVAAATALALLNTGVGTASADPAARGHFTHGQAAVVNAPTHQARVLYRANPDVAVAISCYVLEYDNGHISSLWWAMSTRYGGGWANSTEVKADSAVDECSGPVTV